MPPTASESFDAESINDAQTSHRQLATGLTRIGAALRHHAWVEGESEGLTPTQGQVLALLLHRSSRETRIGDIAADLAVTQATASISLRTMVNKGYIEKTPSETDARATALRLTPEGLRLAKKSLTWLDFLLEAASDLTDEEQAVFQRSLVKMIRALQAKQQIPVSRMCATCQFFRPNEHPGERLNHHCAYVDAAFGDRQLRLDCNDFSPLAPEQASQIWDKFATTGPARRSG